MVTDKYQLWKESKTVGGSLAVGPVHTHFFKLVFFSLYLSFLPCDSNIRFKRIRFV